MRITIILILSLICTFQAKAQDPIFTQFYLVPETLNPAFTGIANTWNAGGVHRRQWPEGNRKVDTQFAYLNSIVNEAVGLGITLMNQNEMFTNLNYFKFNMALAYKINLNYDWRVRFGIESGYGRKDYNFKNLLLEDQININTGTINPITSDPIIANARNKINFFDLAAGVEFDQENTWVGLSIKHLNRPNISFREEGNLPLDMFLSIHGGYYFDFANSPQSIFPEDSTLLLTANYMRQGQYNRLDLGAVVDLTYLGFGLLVATNPEGKTPNSHIVTSLNPVFSIKFNEFTFGYSYDWNISELQRTQGIHELTLIWQSSRRCNGCDDYNLKLKRNGEVGYRNR